MSQEQDNAEVKVSTIEDLEGSSAGEDVSNTVAADPLLAEAQKALSSKTDECKALNDKYLRQAAEFENYKRLAQRDQRDQIKFGNEQLLRELLPVIDNLERAIKAARDSDRGTSSALVHGVDLTLKQLSGSLAKFGVQAIETTGQAFDPTTHQAVAHVPSDSVPANHVVEEFQKGYRLHERMLRAAMVSVSSGPATANEHDAAPN
jgi:molecular chaperone GrpE